MTGKALFEYEVGLDDSIAHSGNYSAYLRSKTNKARNIDATN